MFLWPIVRTVMKMRFLLPYFVCAKQCSWTHCIVLLSVKQNHVCVRAIFCNSQCCRAIHQGPRVMPLRN